MTFSKSFLFYVGIVTLNQALDYDTMMGKELQIQVMATTSSFPAKMAVTTMVFRVADVNDNSPMFEQQVGHKT